MNRPKTAVTATCISHIQADIHHQEAAHQETVHQAVAHLIRINHIIAAQALQVHHGDDNSGSYSGGSTGSSSYHSSSSSYDSYDEGYDDIYMNGDYDYDRYDSDDDYAAGVDDAMNEDYEEW